MNPSNDTLRRLVERIARTKERELDCGEVFALLDEYTEAIIAGEDVRRKFELLVEHLDLCPDCLEEYEALLSILQTRH